MTKRDTRLCAVFFLILFVPFARLLLVPGLIPGNFGDIYIYHYPLRHLITSTLQEGRLPLWNPYIFAGTPLAANPQAVIFYPLSAVHHLFPMAWSLSAEMFFHLFWAWLGAYLLLRKWRLDRAGAWTLAFAYGLSPFLVLRIPQGIPTHLAALSWIPWIWLFAQSPKRLLWSLALALQVLSGHPQFALLNLLALGLWALLRRPKLLLWLVPGAFLSLFLDWIQAGASLEFLRHSVRAYWGAVFSLGYSLKPSYLLTFIYPNVMGNPLQNKFEFPSEYFEMMTAYIGLIPLALALLGLASVYPFRFMPENRFEDTRRRAIWRTSSLLALIAFGLFFSLGENNPLYMPLQKALGLDFLRVPARFSIVILWGLWMAAAAGWRMFCSHRKPAIKYLLVLLTMCDLLRWSLPWIYAEDASQMAANPTVLQVIGDTKYRFATSPDIPSSNKSMLYRLGNITGYEAFYLAPIAVYTSRSEGQASADGSRTYIQKWDTQSMSKLGLKYYLATQPQPSLAPRHQVGPTYIYENINAQPIVQGAKLWQIQSAERIDAWTDTPGTVVFAQADYPGWMAWVNGSRVPVSDDRGLFPRVLLQGRGPWTIHFIFSPGLWFLGLMISLGWAAGMLVYVSRRLKRWTY